MLRVVLFSSCATLNCGDVLQAIGDILLQPPDSLHHIPDTSTVNVGMVFKN